MDPVYTGKAMAGLPDLNEQKYFEPGTNIVFLHTGGTPALFCSLIAMEFFGVLIQKEKVN